MSSSCIECVISLHDAEILQEGWYSFRSTRSRTCDRQHQVDRLNVASNRQLATFNVIELVVTQTSLSQSKTVTVSGGSTWIINNETRAVDRLTGEVSSKPDARLHRQ